MAADRNQGWREAALTGLVERHRTALVRMCCLCLGDASLAEDAAQETFSRPTGHWTAFGESATKRRG